MKVCLKFLYWISEFIPLLPLKPDFKLSNVKIYALQTSSETRADIQLPVGEVTNEVTITAEAPLVQTETSERGSVISGREVTELPLSGRNFTQLATLTPGVTRFRTPVSAAGPDGRSFNNGDPRAGSGGPGSGIPREAPKLRVLRVRAVLAFGQRSASDE